MKRTRLTSAGRLERLFANLVDTLILLLPSAIVYKIMGEGGMTMLLAFLCNVAYYTAFTASAWQATPGKRLLNIHVVRTDARPLNYTYALERFLAYILPSLALYTSFIPQDVAPILVVWLSVFWFAPILFTPERMGMHDRLCNTRVVVGRVG